MTNYYTYYSYEEWGRGYIGSRPSGCKCNPEEDLYMGSFKDKTFKPTKKIILGVYSTPQECLEAEVKIHDFFKLDINPNFANLARQTSTGFISLVKTKEHCRNISKALKGRKLSVESIQKRQQNRIYVTGGDHHMVRDGHTPETKAIIKEKRALQTNIPGKGTRWWVNKEGKRKRKVECPGEGWQQGQKWVG